MYYTMRLSAPIKEPYVRLSQTKSNSCSHQDAAVVGTPVWPGGPRRRLRIQRWPAVHKYILAPFDVFEVFLAFCPILASICLSQVAGQARSLYFTVFLVGATSLSRDFAAPPFEIWAWEGFSDILSPIKNCFLSIYSPFRLLMCFLCGLFNNISCICRSNFIIKLYRENIFVLFLYNWISEKQSCMLWNN